MSGDAVSAANENLHAAFRRLASATPSGATGRFGPVRVAAAGVPTPVFNRAFVFQTPPCDRLTAAVEWLADRDEPFWVTATDDVTVPCSGLEHVTDQPGMVRELGQPVAAPEAAEIEAVTDRRDVAAYSAVWASAFDLPTEPARRLSRAVFGVEGVRQLLARVDGRPVATGLVIVEGAVAGVYNVGVIESFRRRGIATAVTRALLRAGQAADCQIATLQSSDAARSLYEQLGFETVVTYRQFTAGDHSTSSPST